VDRVFGEKLMYGINENQYDSMVTRLKREGFAVFNARSGELFVGHKDNDYPSQLRHKSPSLRRFASVPYHTQQNKTVGRQFKSKADLEAWINGQTVQSELTVGRPTSQFKTVWYSKGMRRQ